MGEMTFFKQKMRSQRKLTWNETNWIIVTFLEGIRNAATQSNLTNDELNLVETTFMQSLESAGIELPPLIAVRMGQ